MNLDIALSILLIFSAACYVLLGIRMITAKREVGSVPIGMLFVIISFWVMGGAVELMSDSFLVFSIGRTGHFIGTALLPLAAFVCFREYTGAVTPLRTIVLLLIVPTVSIALAATNQYHEFMWQLPAVSESGQYLTRPDKWGPWFLFVHAPHSLFIIGDEFDVGNQARHRHRPRPFVDPGGAFLGHKGKRPFAIAEII